METNLLTESERKELIDLLKDECLSRMFGDGMEDSYVMDGFPEWKGISNMSDDELLIELGHYYPEDDTPEKRAARWKQEVEEGVDPYW